MASAARHELAKSAQALSASGAWQEASTAWQHVVEADPQDVRAWNNLGLARAHAGLYPEAIDAFGTGMQRGLPADEVAAGMGLVFCLRQQYDIARENLEMAVASNPHNQLAWSNLVVCYARLGLVEQTFRSAEQVLATDPDNLSALGSLASLCKDLGLADEAVGWARRAADAAPTRPHLVSNLMWAMLHADRVSAADLLEAGREFERRARLQSPLELYARRCTTLPSPACGRGAGGEGYGEGGPAGPGEVGASHSTSEPPPRSFPQTREESGQTSDSTNAPPPHLSPNPSPRRGGELQAASPVIKLGWLSADIRNHAVGRFVVPVLEAFDPQRVESFIYNTGHIQDDFSDRARKVSQWRDAANLSDPQLIERIRHDELDVLIDLAGHTDGSRLSALVQRAAPVQMSWLGFPDTTGLSTIDYVLVPPDPVLLAGGWCSETPLALPCYCVREAGAFDRTPRTPRTGRPFTFGCLNNLAKLSPATIAVWATILGNEPDARLILVATAGDTATIAEDLRARFAAHGADPARLDIRGRMDFAAYQACWREIDLALDPFPFNGGTTGFDALCAGTPFVTLAGDSLHARMGANLLEAVGLSDLVASTWEDYIVKAVSLARDPQWLEQLHADLPARLAASPLLDVTGFAQGLEDLLGRIVRGPA